MTTHLPANGNFLAEPVPRADGPLLIAWGNAQRGDDGAGLAVMAEFLRRFPGVARGIGCHQLTPELAAELATAQVVALIDAAYDAPGAVRWQVLSPAPGQAMLGHALDAATLLAYAQGLYGGAPRAVLVTIGGQEFGFVEGLSAPVAAAVSGVVEQLRTWLTDAAAASSHTDTAVG